MAKDAICRRTHFKTKHPTKLDWRPRSIEEGTNVQYINGMSNKDSDNATAALNGLQGPRGWTGLGVGTISKLVLGCGQSSSAVSHHGGHG
jgi:hypothetical protein